jgi:hypothetical protein
MIIKSVKPRTHLKLDIILFFLMMVMAISSFIVHTASPEEIHLQFVFHRIHGWSGILMCVAVSVHLLLHIPWIRSQLTRWLKR